MTTTRELSRDQPSILGVTDLSWRFNGRAIFADFSLSVRSSEIVLLLGGNGTGKSTIIALIAGTLAPPQNGSIVVLGQDVSELSAFQRARVGIATVRQASSVFGSLSVRENLLVGKSPTTRNVALWALARELLDEAQIGMRSAAGVLSGGQQRVLALAAALLQAPRLLLLDEPLAGLGSQLVRRVVSVVRQYQASSACAVLWVEHPATVTDDLSGARTITLNNAHDGSNR